MVPQIHGKNDQIAELESAKSLANDISARWITVPSGHFPLLDSQNILNHL